MSRLDGKVAWISGATSGIGEATARLFAHEGAAVAIVGQKLVFAQRTARALASTGANVLAVQADVGDEKQVRDSIAQTVRRFGRLDILVNNAGVTLVKPLHHHSERDWDRVMSINVKAMFFSFKHALPHLRQAGRSWVVNVGSISSFVGQALTPVYTASKHAIAGLTKSIALDYAADGVRCNCICPGITDTPMLRKHLNTHPDPEAVLANRLRRVPLAIPLLPEDVARSILFLSCDDSFGITGTTLTIDAGYLAAAEWQSQTPSRIRAGAKRK